MSIAKAHWRLWYDRPAEEWTEALPLGNGKIGGMIYGGIHEERIGLNEETVWSGKPHFDASPGVLQTINQVKLAFEGNYKTAHAFHWYLRTVFRQRIRHGIPLAAHGALKACLGIMFTKQPIQMEALPSRRWRHLR